ncbi:MAG: DNA polymerase Y family protein [Myxococcota bacterium]
MRTACLRVPDLPLAAELRAHPELAGLPLAVASGPGPRAEVVALSPEAARRGVRLRSSVVHARTVCAALRVRVASPALERAAREALLDAALGLSPRAALAPRASGAYAGEAAAFLDASGVTSLFDSERGFASALAARADSVGLPGDVAVAGSRSAALLAARWLRSGEASHPARGALEPGRVQVLPPGCEAAFLAPLPIEVLDPEDDLAESLTRFGVRNVRDLRALPRRALSLRLGQRVLQLIALAEGAETEAPLPAPDRGRLVEAVDLEFPVDRLEPLTFALQGLLSRLLARLEARHLACGDLFLRLDLAGGGRDARRIGLAAPTRDLRVLVRLVCRALEARAPDAPVEGVALEIEANPVRRDQLDLFRPPGPAPSALASTLAELEALCGSGRVGAPEVADDHRPDAFGMGRFAASAAERRAQPGEAERSSAGCAAERRAQPGGPGPELPLAVRALRPPVPAQVRLFRGRPESIRSAVANGRVVRLAGPWRATGGWWSREERFAYDHFDVQTSDGTVARIRLDRLRQTWHVDAVYD